MNIYLVEVFMLLSESSCACSSKKQSGEILRFFKVIISFVYLVLISISVLSQENMSKSSDSG